MSFSYASSVLIGQILLLQIDKPHWGKKNTIKSYVSPHRRDLGITSSLFTAGVSLGKYAGTNSKLRWCDYSFAHLLPVRSEKGTVPPPSNTSCRSVSTWRKTFQTEDASVSSEPPHSLWLTAPLLWQFCCMAVHEAEDGRLENRYDML